MILQDTTTAVAMVSDRDAGVASMQGNRMKVFDWSVTLSSETASYCFVRVYTESGNLGLPGVTAWTAPVWV
jgi:hypothetical protein